MSVFILGKKEKMDEKVFELEFRGKKIVVEIKNGGISFIKITIVVKGCRSPAS